MGVTTTHLDVLLWQPRPCIPCFYCEGRCNCSHVNNVRVIPHAYFFSQYLCQNEPIPSRYCRKSPQNTHEKKALKGCESTAWLMPKIQNSSRFLDISWYIPSSKSDFTCEISYNLIVPKLEFHIWFITYQEWLLNNLNSDISNVFQCCSTHTWSSWPQNKNSGASPVLHDLGSWVAE